MSERLLSWLWRTVLEGSYKSLPIIAVLVALNLYAFFGTILPYLQSRAAGTLTLSAAEVAAMTTVANREQLYQINGSGMADAGFLQRWMLESDFSSTESSRTYFGLLTVQDRLLVVGSPKPIDPEKTSYTGAFSTYQDEDILAGIQGNLAEDADKLLPVYFREYRETFDSGMNFVMAVMAGVFLFTLLTIFLFIRNTLLKKIPV